VRTGRTAKQGSPACEGETIRAEGTNDPDVKVSHGMRGGAGGSRIVRRTADQDVSGVIVRRTASRTQGVRKSVKGAGGPSPQNTERKGSRGYLKEGGLCMGR
jgi:hypothetical protein